MGEKLHGFNGWGLQSDKVLEVAWCSDNQGLSSHVERYRNSRIMHESVDDAYKPALVMRRVIQRRMKEGSPQIPLYCFVHGTALKMYRWELGPKETEEQKSFPMRFHKMMLAEKVFDDQKNGVNACFVISKEQKDGI